MGRFLEAAATSGQAVLVSGATVLVAVAGMLLSGDPTFESIGLGTMTVVACAIVGSLTVLPALMHKLGECNWYLPRRLGWIARLRVPTRTPLSPSPIAAAPGAAVEAAD